ACIIHDGGRAAGRSGLGAVMGSKNLKAVAVRGSTGLGLAAREQMLPVSKWIAGAYKDLMGWAVNNGTSASVGYLHNIGATPVNNFRDPVFPGIEQLDAPHTFPLYMKEHDTCHACPVHCKPVVAYDQPGDARKIDPRYGGPEYESIGALGPVCMVHDPVAVAKANELCAKYGLDTISTGMTTAFVMECAEKRLLPADADFRPVFGSGADLLEAVERIANRRGLGDWMAEGSARMARSIGAAAEQLQVTTRGQELPMHDPRLKNAYGLGYALSPTGADHMHNMDDTYAANDGSDVCGRLREAGIQTPLPLYGLPESKVQAYAAELAAKHIFDSAVICQFYPYEYKHLVPALNAASGWDLNMAELQEIGHRITHMARLFLLREGFTAADDKLPPRCFQPHREGPTAGHALTPQELQDALQTYYRLMDWSPAGVPSPAVLARYGLADLAAGITH
ncbi:MAG: aldehyde ferredoxin oxidoreductase, partial [Anaerolineae bacterium]|nr:aldehyde ferredoxin oxidoreductase [Anaerolineae bacterium]